MPFPFSIDVLRETFILLVFPTRRVKIRASDGALSRLMVRRLDFAPCFKDRWFLFRPIFSSG
jgi:hypothetical protein